MSRTLRKGDRGEDVKALQRLLHLIADGIYGPMTEEAVKDYQRANGLAADGIAGPKTLTALGLYTPPQARRIDKIILHCTATPEGEDYTVEQIRQMHKARGFSDIGYHWLISRDGTIHAGRAESIAGAHCLGQNTHSIGVSYVGGCPARTEANWNKKSKDTRTEAQKRALRQLVGQLQERYPGTTVHCHNEYANKDCPSFKLCDF